MAATLVSMMMVALAMLILESATNSGITPYLAGPKNALWVPSKNIASNANQTLLK